ncbi:MAG: phosphotransferase [Alphaproteobacteria bacterium]|nr:phosphotransferase [Alphaproteobacteria bacterium]
MSAQATPGTDAGPAVTATTQAAPVLDQHRFPEDRLASFMAREVAGFVAPLRVSQFRGGMSNPTFLLQDGNGRRYVMRKKPPGTLLPSAHAVDREYRVISALAETDVPVARAFALCEDEAMIGRAFYIMEHVEGRVARNLTLPDFPPAGRAAVYDAMNAALAALHNVDFRTAGLEGYGREGGYMARQVRRWSGQYEMSKTDEIPEMDNLVAWLAQNMPPDDETAVVHGDYRLENMILHPTEPRVLAVVDWELGTLGNPLSDLAYNCLPYHSGDDVRGSLAGMDHDETGIPSEDDYLAAYCARTGRGGIPDWNFYLAFSLFRLAAISQGVYKRGLDGNASSPDAIQRGAKARHLAKTGWAIAQRGVSDTTRPWNEHRRGRSSPGRA